MNLQQALQIVKQAIDGAVKMGVCPNIDAAGVLAQAWQIILNSVKDKQ
jgi:hypothetical protein